MKTDTWIDEMLKEVNKNQPSNEPNSITLSDNDIQRVADIMIKKMSEVDCVDTTEKDIEPINPNPPSPNKDGEIPLE